MLSNIRAQGTAILALGSWLSINAAAQEVPDWSTNASKPLSTYKSRPDILAPFLNVTVLDESRVTPGYIFLAPYQTTQNGIYIYDNSGNLVWSGHGQTGPGNSHNFHPCPINGTTADYLCYYTGAQGSGYARGYVNILDNTLTSVSSMRSQAGLSNFDEHEFHLVDNGTAALTTLYNPERYDLTAYNISNGQGWLMNCFMQKVRIADNALLFEWSAADHVPISDTYVLPNSTEVSGTGFTPEAAYDYFHINSVDQSANSGSYLVSSRHTSTVYLLDSTTGAVIWRLGGKSSDFTFAAGLNFSQQHNARFVSENASTTVVSLFDNASNGYNPQSAWSSTGKILKLDFTQTPPVASLLREFVAPYQFVSTSQGNFQILANTITNENVDDNQDTASSSWMNSNAFFGWGEQAFVSEYTPNGDIVQLATYSSTGSMSYRAYKANFTTNPPDSPALYTYSLTGTDNSSDPNGGTTFWSSWNGATAVLSYNFYARSNVSTAWVKMNEMPIPKAGFETAFTTGQFCAYTMAEALDVNGQGIRNSTAGTGSGNGNGQRAGTKTFVPSSALRSACDSQGCPAVNSYSTTASSSVVDAVGNGTESGAESTKRTDWSTVKAGAVGLGVVGLSAMIWG